MSDISPSSLVRDGILVVKLQTATGGRETDFDGILDQTDLGEVVGLEILDLKRQLGGLARLAPSAGGLPRWSYDDEIDAFYVRFSDGPAQVQKHVAGRALVDVDGQLASLTLRVSP